MIFIWVVAIFLLTWGTRKTLQRLQAPPPKMDLPFNLYPVSILKPLKGKDSNLEENLEGFFHLKYPRFEIIFSVADAFDPALLVVEKLLKKYPKVQARVVIGQEVVGINPKVNNLVHSYECAKYDFLLISDSNIQVDEDYLKRLMAHQETGVGAITAVVTGMNPRGLGGEIEAMHLNSFCARGMNLAFAVGQPFVVGKSMLIRKSHLEVFGGIAGFGAYIAEDFKIGEAMRFLGLKIVAVCDPVRQQIGSYSVKDFWQRHIRWARIQKTHAVGAFYLQFFTNSILSGFLGAWYLAMHTEISPIYFFLAHLGFWLANDLLLAIRFNTSVRWYFPLVWLLKEFLHLPLLMIAATGNSVKWRGHILRILKGGTVEIAGAQAI